MYIVVGFATVALLHLVAALGDYVAGGDEFEHIGLVGDLRAVHTPAGAPDSDKSESDWF